MRYEYGDLSIDKNKLHDFLQNNIGCGKYNTFDILEKYQGSVKRNEGIHVSMSWNAYFGRILKQCSNDSVGCTIIKFIKKDEPVIIDGKGTSAALWEIL